MGLRGTFVCLCILSCSPVYASETGKSLRALVNACLRGKKAEPISSGNPSGLAPAAKASSFKGSLFQYEGTLGAYATDSNVQKFFPTPHKDSNGFLVAGVNGNQDIERLLGITGVSFETLSERAYPNGGSSHSLQKRPAKENWQSLSFPYIRKSGPGLIAKDQTIKQLLLNDNQFVVEAGLNHQEVATPLLLAMRDFEESGFKNTVFKFNGREFKFDAFRMGGAYGLKSLQKLDDSSTFRSGWGAKDGVQGSPFNDEIFSNYEFTITDLQTGKTLKGDGLTPHLIYRYGFYQGGEFRMPPERIIDFFHLLEK